MEEIEEEKRKKRGKKERKEGKKEGEKEGRTKSGDDHEISVNRKSGGDRGGEVDLTPVKEAIPLRRTSVSPARTTYNLPLEILDPCRPGVLRPFLRGESLPCRHYRRTNRTSITNFVRLISRKLVFPPRKSSPRARASFVLHPPVPFVKESWTRSIATFMIFLNVRPRRTVNLLLSSRDNISSFPVFSSSFFL